MDFAPYQDQSPETNRALSPPPPETRRSFSPNPNIRSPAPILSPTNTPPPPSHPASNPWIPSTNTAQGFGSGDVEREGVFGAGSGGREERLNEFETSLPIRLDYEACLAYLLLPPAGGVLLLLCEQKSDYVRFHAWQSALLFTAVFVLHLIFSWSTFISWLMFVGDVAGIGYLSFRAYRDAETLDRCEVPFFGRLASSILDDE